MHPCSWLLTLNAKATKLLPPSGFIPVLQNCRIFEIIILLHLVGSAFFRITPVFPSYCTYYNFLLCFIFCTNLLCSLIIRQITRGTFVPMSSRKRGGLKKTRYTARRHRLIPRARSKPISSFKFVLSYYWAVIFLTFGLFLGRQGIRYAQDPQQAPWIWWTGLWFAILLALRVLLSWM